MEGPREFAESIKEQVETFLADELKLELSKSKTKLTHLRTDWVHFLGTDIRRSVNFDHKVIVTKKLKGR